MGALIELPWPSPALSPNARSGTFHAKARATKSARADAFYATKAAKAWVTPGDGLLAVDITFYRPAGYRYDQDGLLSRMKPSLDGIADALGVDDVRFRPRIHVGSIIKGGLVTVSVTPL